MPHRRAEMPPPVKGQRLAVKAKLAEHINKRSPGYRPSCHTQLDENPISHRFHDEYSVRRNRFEYMSKRALFPTFLGLLLLTLIACGGFGGEEASEQTDAASTAAPSPTATQAPPTGPPIPTPVATEGDLFLQLVEPTETEVFIDVGSLAVAGRTRVDAMVTI